MDGCINNSVDPRTLYAHGSMIWLKWQFEVGSKIKVSKSLKQTELSFKSDQRGRMGRGRLESQPVQDSQLGTHEYTEELPVLPVLLSSISLSSVWYYVKCMSEPIKLKAYITYQFNILWFGIGYVHVTEQKLFRSGNKYMLFSVDTNVCHLYVRNLFLSYLTV